MKFNEHLSHLILLVCCSSHSALICYFQWGRQRMQGDFVYVYICIQRNIYVHERYLLFKIYRKKASNWKSLSEGFLHFQSCI